MRPIRIRHLTAAVGGLGLAFLAGNLVAQAPPGPTAPAAYKLEDPPNRALDANLYMQTAAEYRACCYQAYNLAAARLREAVAKKPAGKPAVVLDLDETVVDNAGFQAMQLRSGLAYDQRLWDGWERDGGGQLALVPGAKEFLAEATRLGVTVVYISNRSDKHRESTKTALARLGVPPAADELLLLVTDTSDKTKRRQAVEQGYTVLLYIGDNLRDFDEEFRCRKIEKGDAEELETTIRERKEATDRHRADWGEKWIILPNPAYGEWLKPLGRGRADLDRLAPPTPVK